MLAMKRMVRWAAENGFDRMAWATGAMQESRFDLDNGDSMRRFYDEMLPAVMNDFGARFGATVGHCRVRGGSAGSEVQHEVHGIDITPEMRRLVMDGQPLFARCAPDDEEPGADEMAPCA